MVIRLLILVLLTAVSSHAMDVPAFEGTQNHCLECHDVHYAELDSCTGCHRGFAGTARKNIAHENLVAARYADFTLPDSKTAAAGKDLLKNYACRRCHVSGEKGNKLAADLDISQQEKLPEELEESIRDPVLFMPEFFFYQEQRIALINAILLGGRSLAIPEVEQPAVIHFEGEETAREFQFEKHCGSCHRALTARFGGLGEGLIGPNLSGIFSEFYRKSFGDKLERWTVENLDKWLKNPRKVKEYAQMPPVELKQEEFERICSELQHSSAELLPVEDQ